MQCILCKRNLKNSETSICENCIEILRKKYPDPKELERRLEWHIKNAEEIKEQ